MGILCHWACLSNFIPPFYMDIITYPCLILNRASAQRTSVSKKAPGVSFILLQRNITWWHDSLHRFTTGEVLLYKSEVMCQITLGCLDQHTCIWGGDWNNQDPKAVQGLDLPTTTPTPPHHFFPTSDPNLVILARPPPPPPSNRDLNQCVFHCTFGPNMAILTLKAHDWHTHRDTHGRTQATTPPQGQNWPQLKTYKLV